MQRSVVVIWSPILAMFWLSSCAQQREFKETCPPVDHGVWTILLQRYVNSTGLVDYAGFVTDSVTLNQYLKTLSSCPPNASWSENERLAYWINVYNAFTVKLIVDHYPVGSIKEIKSGIPFINSVWDMQFFTIGDENMDLTAVEHGILRKEFDDPRIHFAIVCASRSCPILLNEAYVAERLEEQLQVQTIKFINDGTRNRIGSSELRLSSIFKWFRKDFTRHGSLLEFVSIYSDQKMDATARIRFLDYDWRLNDQ